ncbi:MFS family permease [Sinorhizobium fredii]
MLRFHPATFLFAARALRDTGDGFVAVLLPVYLLALGFTPLEVGVIATASLLGSALLTICVGFLGAWNDHRQLLLAAERAAAASFTSVPRSLAASASPVLAGPLFAASFRAWPLLICGTLKRLSMICCC